MKNVYKKYIVYLIILIIVSYVFIHYWFLPLEGLNHIIIDIGNFLTVYYCTILNSIIEKKDFNINDMPVSPETNIDFKTKFNLDDNDFLKYFPRFLSFKEVLEPYYDKIVSTGLEVHSCPSHYFTFNSPGKIKADNVIKPLVQQLINDSFKKTEDMDMSVIKKDNPVIHFRCADTPFIRMDGYNFHKYSYYKEALEFIEKKIGKPNNRITLLSYIKHRSENAEQKACQEYANDLKKFLETELGYDVEITSHTNVEDFAIMFYAPAVISTGGSYPYMAGFFGYGLFIQPDMINGAPSGYYDFTKHKISHPNIDNYYDPTKVFEILKS
jgi:hypothetical protein